MVTEPVKCGVRADPPPDPPNKPRAARLTISSITCSRRRLQPKAAASRLTGPRTPVVVQSGRCAR
jgi:hypothetical protein